MSDFDRPSPRRRVLGRSTAAVRRRLLGTALLTILLTLAALESASAAHAIHAPTQVTVSAIDAHHLGVSWRQEPRTSYQIRWRAPHGRWRTRSVSTSGQLRLRGLRAGTSYTVEVRACQHRCSRWSSPASATPGNASPIPSASTGSPPANPGALPASGPRSQTQIGGCSMFPANNPWNQDITNLPVDPNSANYIASINSFGDTNLHADFGSDPSYGIPFRVVNRATPAPVNFTEYGDESDPGPYPIPTDSPIEVGGDHHVLVVDSSVCKLYELYHAQPNGNGWDAGSGASFDLNSNVLRPDTWTSTDEAGLPILPGLVRADEVTSGQINHALRFTVGRTQHAFIHPATHYGSSDSPSDPPMGLRLRLRADFDLTPYSGQALVVLQALKRYGMFVADTGTSWYISGATDTRWNDGNLDQLKQIPGSAFEAVQTGAIHRPS